MLTRFDAVALREQDRFPYWHDLICKLFPRAGGRRGDDSPFAASLNRNVLGSVELSEIRCNALRYNRARHDQRLDQSEEFLVSMMVSGRARLEQDGRVAVQGPGDFVLYDAARPFAYDFPQAYHILLAKIPRRVLLGRLQDAERLTAITVAGSTPLGSLAASMLRTAALIDLPGHGTAPTKVGLSLVDILSAAVEMELSGRRELYDRHAALLTRAKDYIRAHFEEPELDVDAIANAVHVSSRTLSRAFATESTTVMRWVWKQRLEASHAALREGLVAQVSDVALACGFVSCSHFSRMFKSAYGVLPHTLTRMGARIS